MIYKNQNEIGFFQAQIFQLLLYHPDSEISIIFSYKKQLTTRLRKDILIANQKDFRLIVFNLVL